MELKIIQEKENLLFKRKEIQGSIESDVTPSRANIKELISKKFSTSDDSIKIKKILGKFGSKTFIINANIYSSKEDKERIEPEGKGKKKEERIEEKVEERIEVKNAESQGDSENKELINRNQSEPVNRTNQSENIAEEDMNKPKEKLENNKIEG